MLQTQLHHTQVKGLSRHMLPFYKKPTFYTGAIVGAVIQWSMRFVLDYLYPHTP
jgi:hypothetical protein